jgi:DNA topoisomerase VI subunit B
MELEEWLMGIGFLAILSYVTATLGAEIFQQIVDWVFKSEDIKIKIFAVSMLLAVFVVFRKRAKEAMPPEARKVEEEVKKALNTFVRKLWERLRGG